MKNRLFIFIVSAILFSGCKNHYTPKPRGYFRIDFPGRNYKPFNDASFPFHFEIPRYAETGKGSGYNTGPFDITVTIPEFKADIHLTYKEIAKNNREAKLDTMLEDSRTLAYKHAVKANAIDERIFMNPVSKVYGTIYMIKGDVASPMQFYLTDSVKHFLRGAFYIRETPNPDSLKPVIDFIEPDIVHLIETTTWN
jgi:gliding motility-associated lipoprotein GldD